MAWMTTYFHYAELNDGKPSTIEEFHRSLGAFRRSGILHLCSVMNAVLRSDDEPMNHKAHDALVRAFFAPQITEYLLRKDGDVRFVFHRQQILFVAKTAILLCPDDGIAPAPPNFRSLGKIFLMAGDHLPDFQRIPEPLDDKFAYIASQLLPVQESSGFHRFDHKISRSYMMLSQSAPRLLGDGGGPYLDMASAFEELTQVPLLSFQSLLYGSLAKFVKFDPQAFTADPKSYGLSRTWFASTKIPIEVIDRFLGLVSATPAELKRAFEKADEGNSDFTPFRNQPFFRDEDHLYLLDFAFLAEKFETGPFWIIHNSFGDKSSRDGLHAFWGRVFERYCFDVLAESTARSKNLFYESPTFRDRNKGQVCDAIIVCGSSAAFVEVKGTTFSSMAKYGGDYSRLKAELDGRLVHDPNGSAKAVEQLKRAIELTCNPTDPEPINGVDLGRVRYVYPVIVTRDDIGSVMGVNAFLQVRFDATVLRKATRKIITPLFCMNAEDLERLTAYLNEIMFTDLLNAHYQANKGRGTYLLNSYFMTDNNPILKEKGLRPPEMHARSWHELTELAAEQLGLQPLHK